MSLNVKHCLITILLAIIWNQVNIQKHIYENLYINTISSHPFIVIFSKSLIMSRKIMRFDSLLIVLLIDPIRIWTNIIYDRCVKNETVGYLYSNFKLHIFH